MDALYDVTAAESEPLVDDSSNGLSAELHKAVVAEVSLKDNF